MAKYVPDIKTQRWVIISESRSGRPISTTTAKPMNTPVCPFCEGNESMTPQEVYRVGTGDKDAPGWFVRVVPNKYPITDVHEVIIHSTDHSKGVDELPRDQIEHILTCYRDRFLAHESDGQVIIFCNHGYHAGASLAHPHAQLVVVPRQINLDAVSLEPIANVVEDTKGFISYCPDFSQWPYEVWIAPKIGKGMFGSITEAELDEFADIFQRSLKAIARVLTDPSQPFKQANEPFIYNYYLYHGQPWFLRIIPRAIHRAGFELGTGLSVNVIDPTNAAERLRKSIFSL